MGGARGAPWWLAAVWHVKPLPLHVSRWDVKLRSHECFLKTASLFLGVTELSVRLLLDDLFDGRKRDDREGRRMFSSFLCSCSCGCLPPKKRVLWRKDFSCSDQLLLLLRKMLPEDDIMLLISACAAFQQRSPSRIWLPPMMQETHFADGSGGAAGSRVQLAGSDKQKHCCAFNELALGPTAGSRVCSSGWKCFSHMSPFYGVGVPIQISSAINENSGTSENDPNCLRGTFT